MVDQTPVLDAPHEENKKKPRRAFLRGSMYVIAFYGVGCVLAALSYSIIGHGYVHGPGLHHIILFFTVAGGFCWTLVAGVKALSGRASSTIKGTLLANTLVLSGLALYLYSTVPQESKIPGRSNDEISVTRNGDTTTLYHDGNPLYMRVGDSVLFNFIDSTNMPSDLVLVVEE